MMDLDFSQLFLCYRCFVFVKKIDRDLKSVIEFFFIFMCSQKGILIIINRFYCNTTMGLQL